jgi:hypothetical protein
MKEISEINELPKTEGTYLRRSRLSKRWKKVSNGTHPNQLKAFNDTKMLQYQFVLDKVKQFLKPGEVYFERDYKDDGEDAFTIHCFLTKSFYWYIECDLLFTINIHYQFYDCSHEQEIREIFRFHNLTHYVTEVEQKPSLPVFYKGVLAYQKPQYIQLMVG